MAQAIPLSDFVRTDVDEIKSDHRVEVGYRGYGAKSLSGI